MLNAFSVMSVTAFVEGAETDGRKADE